MVGLQSGIWPLRAHEQGADADAKDASRGVAPIATCDGQLDIALLAYQVPLPDTAREVCAVARELHLASDDVLLGAQATQTAIETMSDTGKLAQYHASHCATHGTLAGQIDGTSEPGLILTPPREATDLGARIHLCERSISADIALVGGFRRNREADHHRRWP